MFKTIISQAKGRICLSVKLYGLFFCSPQTPQTLRGTFIPDFFGCTRYPLCLSRLSLPDLAGFEPSKANSKRSRTFREKNKQRGSGGVAYIQKSESILARCTISCGHSFLASSYHSASHYQRQLMLSRLQTVYELA